MFTTIQNTRRVITDNTEFYVVWSLFVHVQYKNFSLLMTKGRTREIPLSLTREKKKDCKNGSEPMVKCWHPENKEEQSLWREPLPTPVSQRSHWPMCSSNNTILLDILAAWSWMYFNYPIDSIVLTQDNQTICLSQNYFIFSLSTPSIVLTFESKLLNFLPFSPCCLPSSDLQLLPTYCFFMNWLESPES